MTMFVQIPAFLLATGVPSFSSRISDVLFDDTFKGIHHLQFFDWAVMVPYFAVLAVLSVYGLHRYETIRGYMKHRKRYARASPTSDWRSWRMKCSSWRRGCRCVSSDECQCQQ